MSEKGEKRKKETRSSESGLKWLRRTIYGGTVHAEGSKAKIKKAEEIETLKKKGYIG